MISIIDISSLSHRAWHASGGVPDDASVILNRFIQRSTRESDQVLFVFDAGSQRRKLLNKTYKAHRPPNPPLWAWMDINLQQWRDGGWACERCEGWEADDLAASAIAQYQPDAVTLVSGDRDWWMLVNDTTRVLRPGDWVYIGPQEVYSHVGVHPHQLLQYKSLVGDPSDGIAGVPGIGKKRAAQIVQITDDDARWWTAGALPDNLFRLLEGKEEHYIQAKALITLYEDAPLCIPPASAPGVSVKTGESYQETLW